MLHILPDQLADILKEDGYKRQDKYKVAETLASLDVKVSQVFREFYQQYCGPFWEEHVPYELLDLMEENSVCSYTKIARQEHSFPTQYLILSEMSANAVLVLDSVTDQVYEVDFEGGDELLTKGELKETWPTFYAFLHDYFVG